MFRATFSFASHGEVCGLEIDAVTCLRARNPELQLTYRVKLSKTDDFKVVHVGILRGYAAWSESPLALLLRALFTLRVEWFSAIPKQLINKPMLDMSLSVVHLTRDGHQGFEIASLSLKKMGYESAYLITQSLPNRALIPIELDQWSAVPFTAATQAVKAVQLEDIDLQIFPAAFTPEVLIDRHGQRQILRAQIPYYAVDSFDALSSRRSSRHVARPLVPMAEWQEFLAA